MSAQPKAVASGSKPAAAQPIEMDAHHTRIVPDPVLSCQFSSTATASLPPPSSPTYKNYVTEAADRAIPFPWKLHTMLDEVEDRNQTDVIEWLPQGNAFRVKDSHRFVKEIMPIYFNQNYYKSFQRQLNVWGFSTIRHGTNKGATYHELFRRGKPYLCSSMKRVKNKRQASSSPSAPTSQPEQSQQVAADDHNNTYDVIASSTSITRVVVSVNKSIDHGSNTGLGYAVLQQQVVLGTAEVVNRHRSVESGSRVENPHDDMHAFIPAPVPSMLASSSGVASALEELAIPRTLLADNLVAEMAAVQQQNEAIARLCLQQQIQSQNFPSLESLLTSLLGANDFSVASDGSQHNTSIHNPGSIAAARPSLPPAWRLPTERDVLMTALNNPESHLQLLQPFLTTMTPQANSIIELDGSTESWILRAILQLHRHITPSV